jgi:hypothetical protein
MANLTNSLLESEIDIEEKVVAATEAKVDLPRTKEICVRKELEIGEDKKMGTFYSFNTRTKQHRMYYQCQVQNCGKEFAKKYNYNNHSRTHTNEKPFSCSFCDKLFN